MAELLFEIGTEELPAGFIDPALAWLEANARTLLDEARLPAAAIRVDGTPRRLTLIAEGLPDKQSDKEEEVTGPRVDIAYKDGALSKAGAGFLRSRGLSEADAFQKETKKGTVIAAIVREAGLPAAEVLPGVLHTLLDKLPFKKTMRWGDEDRAFARPLQWLLALLDGAVVPVSFAGVTSGNTTCGHRYHAPAPVAVDSVASYMAALEAGRVMLSRADRRDAIRAGATALGEGIGAVWIEDEALLDVVKNLVEHPWPLLGRFDEKFLEIPQEILISEMREHQKCFGYADKDGRLVNAFLVVAGSEPVSEEAVAQGNARVMRARFEDGAFYFKDDQATPLADFAAKLERVVFQRDLGTVADKAARIGTLAGGLASTLGLDADASARVARTAALCKADLVSGVVGEFPELQGTMGRIYATAAGEDAAVAAGIEAHYLPKGAGDAIPNADEGALVGLGDRLDTLTGIFGIGKAPKGTADPFGLRRAAIGLTTITIGRGYRYNLSNAIAQAVAAHGDAVKGDAAQVQRDVHAFIKARARGVLIEREAAAGYTGAGDIVDGALSAGSDDLTDLAARVRALSAVRADDNEAFLQLAAAFKRVGNIVKKARKDSVAITDGLSADLLVEPAEKVLLAETEKATAALGSTADDLDAGYRAVLQTVAELKPHVDKFFDDVMVMTDDETLRSARLGLLASLEAIVTRVADFTRIQLD